MPNQQGLAKFVAWAQRQVDARLAIFFTPWGEALVRQWYRRAIGALSQLPQVHKIAVQTNLSCELDWLADVQREKLALWCTYHPDQVSRAAFVAKCERLREHAVRHSVGCVGLREHLEEIQALRQELPPETYLWINAYKSVADYYDATILRELESIDPHFPTNNVRHVSRQRACRTGLDVVTVDGDGDIRRCHFVDEVIGNLYQDDLGNALFARDCPNATCGCHIGYVHLEHLELRAIYGDGVLERIPTSLAMNAEHGERINSASA